MWTRRTSGETSWLLTERSRVRFPALLNFLRSWNGVHSALVSIKEELLERKSSGSGLEN
jgi:hypothetical protein